jgi:CHAT domain-containing protein/tetratricopeptide (TPR) repeat protein
VLRFGKYFFRSMPVVVALAICVHAAAADPVMTFIINADSLSRAGTGELEKYIADNPALVGAAVAQLLDVGFEVGEAGDTAAENENVDFAARVAEIYLASGGTGVSRQLVDTYRAWGKTARLTRAEAKALQNQADEARNSEPDLAIDLYTQAIEKYEQINDLHSIAVVWGGLGVAYWHKGDFETVEQHYAVALEARIAVEDRILEGRTLNGLGSANLRQGDNTTAAEYYARAIEVRRATGDLAGLGTSITYLGHCYTNMGRLVDARDRYEEALPILEALDNPGKMVDVLNGIAICYSNMGRRQRAAETYLRAAEYAQAAGDKEKEIQCRLNLVDDYRVAGRFSDAFDELAIIEGLLAGHTDTLSERVFYRTRGMTWAMVGAEDNARDDLLKSIQLAEALEDPRGQMEGLINLAWLYDNLGAIDRGLKAGERAKVLAEQHADARKYRDAMATIGNLYARRGEYQKALEYWGEALAQDEYDGFEALVLSDRISIAGYKAAMGDFQGALGDFHAIAPAVEASGNESEVTLYHLGMAHACEKTDVEQARTHYEAALSQVEASRSGLAADESRSGFLSGERRYYFEEVARYYASLDNGENGRWSNEAFVTIERAKARGLLDLIAVSEAARTTDAEEKVLDELYRLDSDSPGYKNDKARLEAEIEQLREKRLKNAIGNLDTVGSLADLETVRSVLDKNTVLLQYALGDTTSLLWVVDREGHELFRLPNRAGLEPDITRFKDAIRQPGLADEALRAAARSLYVLLLEPAADRLDGAKNLVIIPDGFLHEIPFEALLTEDPEDPENWSKLPYLTCSVSTVYAPSATIYLKLRGSNKVKYDRDLLAYGDPDFSLFGGTTGGGGGGGGFEPLPYARTEIEAVSSQVKEKNRLVRTGAEASERDFKRDAASGSARVYHFATHGLVNPAEPGLSSVVLCPDADGEDDGYLRTTEILAMQMRTGVAVVSACETALGRVTRGEGVVGLSRAFIASGATGVVASLWAVSDESTSYLMKYFYNNMLGKKRPAGRSLREARLKLIEDDRYSHPFYWSPFVVIGADKTPW